MVHSAHVINVWQNKHCLVGRHKIIIVVRETFGHDAFSGTVVCIRFETSRPDEDCGSTGDGSGPVLLRKRLEQVAFRVKPLIVILTAAFFLTCDSHRYSRVLQSR